MAQIMVIDPYYYTLCALCTIGMQLSFFAVANGCKFDLVTDFAGSTNFVLLACLSLALSGDYGTRAIVMTSLLCVTRLYLAFFLLLRVCKRKKDARFDEVRNNCCAFLFFWVYQMFWVFLCSLPVIYVNAMEPRLAGTANASIGFVDYLGWVVFGLGIVIQIVADVQKYNFRSNPNNKGAFCKVGLWAYSRHPNYYGEILIWLGAFVATIPTIHGSGGDIAAGVATVLSPVFTIFVLTRFSGLPTCEGQNLSRYYDNGNGDAWNDYSQRTAPIILQPQCLYAVLPLWFKRAFCCEWESLKYKKELKPLDTSNVDINA